jgi:mannose-6-phosphate isomerase
VFLMKNRIRPYPWGSCTAIASMFGEPVPSSEPQAELWVGAHPADSSVLVHRTGDQPLLHAVCTDPEGTLGPQVAREFDGAFPFLLKLLAADSPLSLQAHPTSARARAGFTAEEAAGVPLDAPHRNYKDRSHKPEMMYALTPFEALCGFRPTGATVRLLDTLAVDELADLRAVLARRPGESGLRHVVTTVLATNRSALASTVDALAAACRAHANRLPGEHAGEFAMAARLADHYPGDPGVLIALLMNRIDLAPGEAVYLPAGNLHAYLSGFGVEIMASSDNVRGGLTTKHVDVAELSAVVSFTPHEPRRIVPIPVAPGELAFRTPSPEFELSRIQVDPSGRIIEHGGPQILLVVDGSVTITDSQGDRLVVGPGRSVFLPARQGPVWVDGAGVLFRARDGLVNVAAANAAEEAAAPGLSLAS